MQKHLHLYPNLVNARKATCSQKELAKRLGITQQEISRYERGETKAPVNYIIDVASVCKVSVDYILGINGQTTDPLSYDEFELIKSYRGLTAENKIKMRERAQTLLEVQKGA